MNKTFHISLIFLIMIFAFFTLWVHNASAISNIIAAEYFIDVDPGNGNGIAIPAKDGYFDSTTEDIEISLDTSSLKIGLHTFYIRMKNGEGVWGTQRKAMFEVTGYLKIAGAECFADTDPGAGNGIPIPANDSVYDQAKEDGTITIDTSNLSLGLHTLYVRMKDSEGYWGTPRRYKFEVVQPDQFPPTIISAAEYCIDFYPDDGSCTALNPQDGSFDSSIENLMGNLNTTNLDYGLHTLYVRAMDSYGRWGAAENTSFTVTSALMGDLNHDDSVDISDVILVLRIALALDTQKPCSDINNDTKVDISDVILTLRMALGLDPLKPCAG